MYKLRVIDTFDAAHFLGKGYKGKCSMIHGHTYKVETVWASSRRELSDQDFVVDFSVLKALLHKVIDSSFDHKFLNEIPSFDGYNPTAEVISRVIYKALKVLVNESESMGLGKLPVFLDEVIVWETSDCGVVYSE